MPIVKKVGLEKIFGLVPALIAVYDIHSGKYLYTNDFLPSILGYSKDSFIENGVSFAASLIHPDDLEKLFEDNNKALKRANWSNGKTMDPFVTFEYRMKHQDGTYKWLHTDGVVFDRDENGQVKTVMNISIDITSRKEQEMREAEVAKEAQKRTRFFEKATNVLISSLDYQTTLKNIAAMIVPQLADYCRIAVKDEVTGAVKEVSLNHVDPKKLGLARELYQQYKGKANITYGVDHILKTGKPELIHQLTPDILKPFANDKKLLKILEDLRIKSYMGVPLKARGKIIGAITFSSTKDGVYYTKANLSFAEELAYRLALALDNAKLFANERTAVRVRDDFISIASHELKTPITSIKGYIQILLGQGLGEKSNYFVSRLDEQVNRLIELVNDLLDVSKIQSGKLELNKEKISLNNLIKETLSDVESLLGDHKIEFKEEKDVKVYVDKFRLSQVLINLLTNAIKYSPKTQKIFVKTSFFKGNVQIKIQDFGIGISQINLKKIFEPFYQADTKVRQSFGGLGLGLHISHEIIKRHGGDILVESEKGVGSTFTVVLPIN